jgi:hypothetical protein
MIIGRKLKLVKDGFGYYCVMYKKSKPILEVYEPEIDLIFFCHGNNIEHFFTLGAPEHFINLKVYNP